MERRIYFHHSTYLYDVRLDAAGEVTRIYRTASSSFQSEEVPLESLDEATRETLDRVIGREDPPAGG